MYPRTQLFIFMDIHGRIKQVCAGMRAGRDRSVRLLTTFVVCSLPEEISGKQSARGKRELNFSSFSELNQSILLFIAHWCCPDTGR